MAPVGACGKALVVRQNRASHQQAERSQVSTPLDEGPFFHGTVADLKVGDLLTAGRPSNYRPEIVMNHVYFTARIDGAGLAAEIAAELAAGGPIPRVYAVEPTGTFENDPNVTDKKFPGNPTRSYRSTAPLRIVSEITGWTRLTPAQLQMWRERLSALLSSERGVIIN
jgi:rifampin ADP-ribosylating transferase